MTSGNYEAPDPAGPPAGPQPQEPPHPQPGGGPQYAGAQPGYGVGGQPQYTGQHQYSGPGFQYGPPVGQYGNDGGSGHYGGYGASGAGARPASGRVGALILAALSAVLGIVAFTAVDWYSGSAPSTFSDVRRVVTGAQTKPFAASVSHVYFGWLAWVLLAVVVVAAVLAAVPRFSSVFRVVGVLTAVGSIVVTFIAVKFFNSKAGQISSQLSGYSTYLKHARAGFWMAVAAFLVAGISAAIPVSGQSSTEWSGGPDHSVRN